MPHSSCNGPVHRREFLRAGALALGGLGLSDVLAARHASGATSVPATSVILFWMWGGPSQLETWDMKPNAPSEYRGPFSPIATNVPGLDICELFPQLAKVADKYSLVRSLHHEMASHNDGSIELLTGKTPSKADPTSTAKSEHPDFGMFTSRVRGAHAQGLPQYVGIPRQPFMTQSVYLGMSHQAFATGDPSVKDFRPPNLTIDAGTNGLRLDDRRGLVTQLDRLRRDLDLGGSLEGIDQFRQQAYQLLTSTRVATAFDLEQEDPKLRDCYGRHLWGQSCLLARRLAESGVSVVTIDAMAPKTGTPLYFSWDDHANAQPGWDLAKGMQWRAEYMDPALSTLIEDIHARGLDQKILVVAVGEFGRTPRLSRNSGNLGRDHWPQAQAALISGGGLRMGQVVGATNSKAEYPAERPLTPQDLMSTIYRHLGIDQHREFADFAGRPHRILSHGQPIRELV
ncbi:MAG: DUF1501 domain-containing protein [Planctomycetales bacterium]|nr:DUF1501 domain-containing protein [Planctomycetales bacterium]